MADSDWLPLLSLQIVSSGWSGVASRFWLSWFFSTNKIFCIWKKGTRNDWEIIYLSIYLSIWSQTQTASLLFSSLSALRLHTCLYIFLFPQSPRVSVLVIDINPIFKKPPKEITICIPLIYFIIKNIIIF